MTENGLEASDNAARHGIFLSDHAHPDVFPSLMMSSCPGEGHWLLVWSSWACFYGSTLTGRSLTQRTRSLSGLATFTLPLLPGTAESICNPLPSSALLI